MYKNIHSDNPDLRYPNTVLLTGYEGSTARPIDLAVGEITRLGTRNGPLFVRVPANVTVANTSAGDRGVWDTTTRTPANMSAAGPGWRGYDAPEPFLNADFTSITNSKPYNGYLELEYALTDQIQLTSLTGFSSLNFDTVRGATSPWATGNRFRGEEFDQWSQELRLTSDTGGKFEWMAGVYWQQNNLNTQSDSWEANQRFAMRGNRAHEDSEWLSAFVAITYDINEQFSLDLGGRYSRINKEGAGYNVQAAWIVEDPVTGLPSVRTTGVQMPASFHQAPVVGRTPYFQGPSPDTGADGVVGEIRERDFNPQVVLRYRPTDSISTYVKYAKATKAGGFDTAVAWLPSIDEDFTFDRETTAIFEGGLRASLFDGAG
ncbi:MAG: TonB-dependent receptor, partial [Pseudohongiellaceae bacterium]